MSANPLELFTAYGGLSKPTEVAPARRVERRKRARTHVHWPVLLIRMATLEAVESITQDLSIDGFYCISQVPFTPGEALTCALQVPTHDPSGKELDRRLECKVRVLRTDPGVGEGMFGIACRIEDYHFAHAIENMH
jgi:hypothetical protein